MEVSYIKWDGFFVSRWDGKSNEDVYEKLRIGVKQKKSGLWTVEWFNRWNMEFWSISLVVTPDTLTIIPALLHSIQSHLHSSSSHGEVAVQWSAWGCSDLVTHVQVLPAAKSWQFSAIAEWSKTTQHTCCSNKHLSTQALANSLKRIKWRSGRQHEPSNNH